MIDEPPARSGDPAPDPSGVVTPMSVPWAAAWSLGVIGVWILVLSATSSEGSSDSDNLIRGFVAQVVAYLVGLFLILRVHAPEASIRDFLAIRRTNVAFYPLAIGIGLAAQMPVQSLYAMIERRWPSSPEAEDRLVKIFAECGTAKRALLGVILVLVGPLVEEVLFRGALFRPMLKRNPAVIVVTFTSIAFALAHLVPQSFVPMVIAGAAMGIVRAQSGSLGPSLLLHATFNSVPYVALMTAHESAKEEWTPPLWLTAVSSVVALALLGVVIVVGARSKAAARARALDRR